MKQNCTGADDGIHILLYEKGEEYEVGEDLANNFIGQGVADLKKTEIPKKVVKEVIKKVAPENKKVNNYDNKKYRR
jgi:hypothetical protein